MDEKTLSEEYRDFREEHTAKRLNPKPEIQPETSPRRSGGALDVINRHTPTELGHSDYLRAKKILADARKGRGLSLGDDERAVLRRDMFAHIDGCKTCQEGSGYVTPNVVVKNPMRKFESTLESRLHRSGLAGSGIK